MSTTIGTDSNWSLETTLDVEWAHAIAPNATILLVEAASANSTDLLSAVDYAANRPNVTAVSMSWGVPESAFSSSSDELSLDSNFVSSNGAVFFASSGDNGSQVIWPSSSPNVVAVGGTTLNLNTTNNAVISETAWSGSSGGVSVYEPIPNYQAIFGLTGSKRLVPDVSYNADPQTGVLVYYSNSGWCVIGGTSAGPPQWAAIQALGSSASNVNLYVKAKLAYSSYFRDITSGSSVSNNASEGYDMVTGLGSPLTDNFNSILTVSPTSGPAGGAITLEATGFAANDFLNISYLNPLNSSWVPIVNNVQVNSTQNFPYTLNAPDLLQNNTVGDNQPLFDNISFQVHDNSTGGSYNTTIPYMEWRRGLIQVGDNTATGLYGNNTNLSAVDFVQNDQSISVAGEWFSPGNVSLLWDGTTILGNDSTEGNGFFNATVQVPITSAGQHTLTINDGASNFCANITRLPTVANDYTPGWHTENVTVNLIPDFNVNAAFYRINNGPVNNVSENGQPVIATEGNNNTLEYWGTWNVYGTGNMELQHVILTGVQLETTPPTGSLQINNGNTSTSVTLVTLNVSTNNTVSGINQIRFSNNGIWNQVPWKPYTTSSVSWPLISGDGVKTVYCQIEDNAGMIATFNSSTNLITPQPSSTVTPSPTPTPPTPTPTTTPSPTPTNSPIPSDSTTPINSPTSTSSPSPSQSPTSTITSSLPQYSVATETPSPKPSETPQAPELSIQMFIVLALMILPLVAVILKKRKLKT
jgi:hypothetical protein